MKILWVILMVCGAAAVVGGCDRSAVKQAVGGMRLEVELADRWTQEIMGNYGVSRWRIGE